jgi:hypothetical protein
MRLVRALRHPDTSRDDARGESDDALRERDEYLERIEKLLAAVLKVPRAWTVLALGGAIASSITVGRDARGVYGFEFRVTWITAVVVALVWLPALLRVTSLVGGGVKASASGVEATTGGLAGLLGELSASSKREVLPSVIAALDTPDVRGKPQIRDLRSALESELADASPDDAHAALENLARRYDQMRDSLPPGDERTFLMTRIVAQARALASGIRLPEDDARRYFEEGAPGMRIVALSIVQTDPSAALLDVVLSAIAESKSAFEQYHALRALDAMFPQLSPAQKRRARETVEQQRGPGGWITPEDPDRWDLSGSLVRKLTR